MSASRRGAEKHCSVTRRNFRSPSMIVAWPSASDRTRGHSGAPYFFPRSGQSGGMTCVWMSMTGRAALMASSLPSSQDVDLDDALERGSGRLEHVAHVRPDHPLAAIGIDRDDARDEHVV